MTPPGPPTPSLTAGGTGRQAETVNYEVGKKTTRSIVPRGDVARLSVAVVVDNARQSKTDAEGKVTRTSTPRPQAEMQKIQQLVAAAVGLDTDRGDQLIVENVSFDEPVDEPAAGPTLFERVGGGAQNWARPAIVLVVGLVALLFVLRPIVRGVFSYAPPPPPPPPATRVETQPLPGQLPKTIEEVEQNIEAELDAKLADHLSHRKTPVLQRRVVRAIETEPENAARLVRAWLPRTKHERQGLRHRAIRRPQGRHPHPAGRRDHRGADVQASQRGRDREDRPRSRASSGRSRPTTAPRPSRSSTRCGAPPSTSPAAASSTRRSC